MYLTNIHENKQQIFRNYISISCVGFLFFSVFCFCLMDHGGGGGDDCVVIRMFPWASTVFLCDLSCNFNCDTYCGWIRYVMLLGWHYLMWIDNDLIFNRILRFQKQNHHFRIPQIESLVDVQTGNFIAQSRINFYFQFILKLFVTENSNK